MDIACAGSLILNWRKKANVPADISDERLFRAIEETCVQGIDGSDDEAMEIADLRQELGLKV